MRSDRGRGGCGLEVREGVPATAQHPIGPLALPPAASDPESLAPPFVSSCAGCDASTASTAASTV